MVDCSGRYVDHVTTKLQPIILTGSFSLVGILSLVIGIMNGWTSPYLAKLTQRDSEIFITTDEASWVASVLGLGRAVGALSGGLSQFLISNKKTLFITGLPTALGWVCLTLATNVSWIYAARLFSGFGMGMFYASYPLFMGEVSNPKIRGSLCGFIMSCMPIGNLLGTLMGPLLSVKVFAAISMVPTLVYMVLFYLLPESPHYLCRIEKYDEAERSMRWYQRDLVDTNVELESLKHFVKMKESQTFCDILREMWQPKNRQAIWIIHNVFFFMQLSGVNTINFYMEIVLKNAMVTAIRPSTVVYVVSAIGIISSWVALRAIDKYGRRIMLAVSSAGTAVSFALYSCQYGLLHENYGESGSLQWLAIVASFVVQISICVGISPVPSILLGEMLAPNIKSTAACFVSILSGFYAFVSSKTYQPLVDYTSEEAVFGFYALMMVLQVIFIFSCLPETKGKSLQEIQDMLTQDKQKNGQK